MNHISIEGIEGIVKSRVCKLISEKIGYQYVEKSWYFLVDDKIKQYQKISNNVDKSENGIFTSWYYGLNNIYLYEKYKDKNIVTDSYIVSNYCSSGSKDSIDIYNLILKKIGKPQLTVILYANQEVITNRLKTLNINDYDFCKIGKSEDAYEKMIYFCEIKNLNYLVIDTSNISVNEVVEKIIKQVEEINKI